MPDFADRLVEELDDLIDGHAGLFRSCLDAEAAAKVIRKRCVDKPSGTTRLTEGGEATVNKDTGTVRIAAGKGIVNGEPVSWEASEQAYELIEKPSAEDGDEDGR